MIDEAVQRFTTSFHHYYGMIPGDTGQKKVEHVAYKTFQILPLVACGFIARRSLLPAYQFYSKQFLGLDKYFHPSLSNLIQKLLPFGIGMFLSNQYPNSVGLVVKGMFIHFYQDLASDAIKNSSLPMDKRFFSVAYGVKIIVQDYCFPLIRHIFLPSLTTISLTQPPAASTTPPKPPTFTTTCIDLGLSVGILALQFRYAPNATLFGLAIGTSLEVYSQDLKIVPEIVSSLDLPSVLKETVNNLYEKILADRAYALQQLAPLGTPRPLQERVRELWSIFNNLILIQNPFLALCYAQMQAYPLASYYRSLCERTGFLSPTGN